MRGSIPTIEHGEPSRPRIRDQNRTDGVFNNEERSYGTRNLPPAHWDRTPSTQDERSRRGPPLGGLALPCSHALDSLNCRALNYADAVFDGLAQELLLQVLISSNDQIISTQRFALGSKTSTGARFQDLFWSVFKSGATSFVLVHNHPSGDPRPSMADIRVTSQINALCRALDVRFVDHLIRGGDTFFSFREAGLL